MKIILFIIAVIVLIGEVSAFRFKKAGQPFNSFDGCMADSWVSSQFSSDSEKRMYCGQ